MQVLVSDNKKTIDCRQFTRRDLEVLSQILYRLPAKLPPNQRVNLTVQKTPK